ncbi:MAG: hypothetical protein K0Q97_2945 [Bacillota bacterium]|jgi:hypothetical protein|nr:hypothetical protein [Bacillota bacterium]
MSFWGVMNWIIWFLCIILAGLILTDFIKVEIDRSKKKK